MTSWENVCLSEISDTIDYGYTASAIENEVGHYFLRITDIVNKNVKWSRVPYCYISDIDFEKYKLEKGDIVIARTGATTGAHYMIRERDPATIVFASYLIRFKINKKKAYSDFINYILKSYIWKEYVKSVAGGSAQPGANAKVLGSFSFYLPPLPEQKAIAGVLGSLDDKIGLLQRQNATLEAMAETLFRQWFIEDTQDDFCITSLSNIANFLNGIACQKYPPSNSVDKLPVLKIRELNNGISKDCDWATSDIKSEYIVKSGDVIFSWSGSLLVKVWSGEDCVLNQHLFKLTSQAYPKWFYYFWCKYHLKEFLIISESHATTMGHIKRSDLDAAEVLIPTDKRLQEMSCIMTPLWEKYIINQTQIRTLEKLRDTLLPKLMGGEVRVRVDE